MPSPRLQIYALTGIPIIKAGDDLAEVIVAALRTNDLSLEVDDVLVVTSKIVSKSENRFVNLRTITPSDRAREVAEITQKDPRLVELILREAHSISRMKAGTLITRHRLGFVSASSAIDQSNVEGDDEWALLLPEDPDESARRLRQGIGVLTGVVPAIVISDTHGRPFRLGNVGVAVGAAGLPALLDLRGTPDLFSRRLQHTDIGLADELASAADLVSGQAAEGLPVTLIRGIKLPSHAPRDGKASDLNRPPQMDLYRE